jgi:hypothetical protein
MTHDAALCSSQSEPAEVLTSKLTSRDTLHAVLTVPSHDLRGSSGALPGSPRKMHVKSSLFRVWGILARGAATYQLPATTHEVSCSFTVFRQNQYALAWHRAAPLWIYLQSLRDASLTPTLDHDVYTTKHGEQWAEHMAADGLPDSARAMHCQTGSHELGMPV